MAAILAIARFCEPSSELRIEEKWYRRTALEDLLGVPPEKVHTDRLYDVTSTYFEGDVEGCEIAKRGYSRDPRGDRPQVCIGPVVTEEGFPLGYEVFAGNMHDSLTVKSVVEALERKHGALNRVWVMDRGMVSSAGLGDAPRTLLDEFATIKSGDIVLPAESAAGIRTTVRLRHVTEPEAEQKTLLQRLGLTLPRRLKRLDSPAQMECRL